MIAGEKRIRPLQTTPIPDRDKLLLSWYAMPESFSAALVESAIDEFDIQPGKTVLDPFCGAGTTLVAAKLRGRNALGIEVNPFLCFVSQTKAQLTYDLRQLERDERKLFLCIEQLRKSPDFPLFGAGDDGDHRTFRR